MFNRIAKTYDSVNLVLSFGLDTGWRKKVGQMLPQKSNVRLLDLATGTADQVLSLVRRQTQINHAVGMDLSDGMLDIGREKSKPSSLTVLLHSKMEMRSISHLKTAVLDAVTISFGNLKRSRCSKVSKRDASVLSNEGKPSY